TADDDGAYQKRVETSAGPDRTIGTADDVELRWKAWKYPAGHIQRWYYGDPGADHAWGTDDDVVTKWTDSELVAGPTREKNMVTYVGAGADGTWGTADDVATDDWRDTIDELARTTRSVRGDAGPDGKGGTADDVTHWWLANRYDGDGRAPT